MWMLFCFIWHKVYIFCFANVRWSGLPFKTLLFWIEYFCEKLSSVARCQKFICAVSAFDLFSIVPVPITSHHQNKIGYTYTRRSVAKNNLLYHVIFFIIGKEKKFSPKWFYCMFCFRNWYPGIFILNCKSFFHGKKKPPCKNKTLIEWLYLIFFSHLTNRWKD